MDKCKTCLYYIKETTRVPRFGDCTYFEFFTRGRDTPTDSFFLRDRHGIEIHDAILVVGENYGCPNYERRP